MRIPAEFSFRRHFSPSVNTSSVSRVIYAVSSHESMTRVGPPWFSSTNNDDIMISMYFRLQAKQSLIKKHRGKQVLLCTINYYKKSHFYTPFVELVRHYMARRLCPKQHRPCDGNSFKRETHESPKQSWKASPNQAFLPPWTCHTS
jgi:hypothetical protein